MIKNKIDDGISGSVPCITQKGCYAYKKVDDDIRKQIDYGS